MSVFLFQSFRETSAKLPRSFGASLVVFLFVLVFFFRQSKHASDQASKHSSEQFCSKLKSKGLTKQSKRETKKAKTAETCKAKKQQSKEAKKQAGRQVGGHLKQARSLVVLDVAARRCWALAARRCFLRCKGLAQVASRVTKCACVAMVLWMLCRTLLDRTFLRSHAASCCALLRACVQFINVVF